MARFPALRLGSSVPQDTLKMASSILVSRTKIQEGMEEVPASQQMGRWSLSDMVCMQQLQLGPKTYRWDTCVRVGEDYPLGTNVPESTLLSHHPSKQSPPDSDQ